MFNWICPQCGTDVPPSRKDCPVCAERARAVAAAPSIPFAIPVAIPVASPVAVAASQPVVQIPPHQYPPPVAAARPAGPPTWLMGVGFAVVFIALGAGVYFAIQHFGSAPAAQKEAVVDPGSPARRKVAHPYQKYLEVVGTRIISKDKQPLVRYVLVNHSSLELSDLAGSVTLWASTSHSDEEQVGSFSFIVPSIGPYDSKDLSAPLKTTMKMFELPDWQNLNAEIQITSPPAP